MHLLQCVAIIVKWDGVSTPRSSLRSTTRLFPLTTECYESDNERPMPVRSFATAYKVQDESKRALAEHYADLASQRMQEAAERMREAGERGRQTQSGGASGDAPPLPQHAKKRRSQAQAPLPRHASTRPVSGLGSTAPSPL